MAATTLCFLLSGHITSIDWATQGTYPASCHSRTPYKHPAHHPITLQQHQHRKQPPTNAPLKSSNRILFRTARPTNGRHSISDARHDAHSFGPSFTVASARRPPPPQPPPVSRPWPRSLRRRRCRARSTALPPLPPLPPLLATLALLAAPMSSSSSPPESSVPPQPPLQRPALVRTWLWERSTRSQSSLSSTSGLGDSMRTDAAESTSIPRRLNTAMASSTLDDRPRRCAPCAPASASRVCAAAQEVANVIAPRKPTLL